MVEKSPLVWIDYLIIVITLCVSTGIGSYYNFKEQREETTKAYFTAAGSMGTFPIGFALMAEIISPITTLGFASEIYTHEIQFFVYIIGFLLATPFISYLYIPVFYKLQATSMFLYLEKRFGITTRLTASVMNFVQVIFYSGIVLFSPALSLETTAGIPKYLSIFVIGFISAIYSSIGGIKAVLITDILQGVIMIGAGTIIVIIAVPMFGGIGEIWSTARKGNRIKFDNFSLDPTERHTFFGIIIQGVFMFISINVNQVQMQRFLTARHLGAARSALFISWASILVIVSVICITGLLIDTAYKNCDPLEGRISQTDMLYPLLIMDNFSNFPGVAGLFIAALFSASLSTISATSNSLAAVAFEDYLKPAYKKCTKKEFPANKELSIGKVFTFFIGIFIIGMAVVSQYLGGILQDSLTITGLTGGLVVGMFTLGMLFESATEQGAIIGVLSALVFCTWIAIGYPRPPPPPNLPISIEGCDAKNTSSKLFQTLNVITSSKFQSKNGNGNSPYFYLYRISYVWYNPIAFFLTVIIGFIFSNFIRLISDGKQKQQDPDLFFPIIANRMRHRRSENENKSAIEMKTRA